MVRSDTVKVSSHLESKESCLGGGWWQTKFNVSPDSGLLSRTRSRSGLGLGPGLGPGRGPGLRPGPEFDNKIFLRKVLNVFWLQIFLIFCKVIDVSNILRSNYATILPKFPNILIANMQSFSPNFLTFF